MSHHVYRNKSGSISLRTPRHAPALLVAMLLGLCAIFWSSLNSGSFDLSASQIWQSLFSPEAEQTATTVIRDLRLPRFLAAGFIGMMLGLSGAILQLVTRNPLADPSLVGVSQGASLSVVAIIVLWPSAPLELRPLAGFCGAILAAALVQWIASGKSSTASLRFILVGVGVSAGISACTSAILTYGQINHAAAALAWLAGSVHTASWNECMILALGFLCILPCLAWAIRPLAALRFGPEVAIAMGLNLQRDRALLIALAVALAAVSVSMAGPLGFIGLIASQLVRRLIRAGVATHIALTALTGGCLVTLADLLGRTIIAPIQLPAGLISAAIGAPLFILLILKGAKPKHL